MACRSTSSSIVTPDHDNLAAQLDHRCVAALRLVPLDDGRRDPELDLPERPRHPHDFGLSPRELTAEAYRLRRLGWLPWEIAARLVRPGEMELAA